MKKDYFNRTQKLVTVLIDAIVFVVGIFLSFWMRFGMVIPQRNLDDGKAALMASVIAFLIINVLSGVYVLYNKTLLDIGIITVVDQVMVTIVNYGVDLLWAMVCLPAVGPSHQLGGRHRLAPCVAQCRGRSLSPSTRG